MARLAEAERALAGIDQDGVTGNVLAGEDLHGERILEVLLDCPLQRPGAVDRVVPVLGEEPPTAAGVSSRL